MAKKSKAKASRKAARRGAKATRRPALQTRRSAKSAKSAKKSAKKKPASGARKTTKATKTARPKASARRAAPTPKKARPAAKSRTATPSGIVAGKRPNLDRERRTIREEDMIPSPPSSLNLDRSASAARSGRAEFEQRLREHTSTGPALTGGDVDADWEDAEAVGEEAPGGDNPTPDQDVVDEIGRAMGIEYEDDEELQGGDELAERDRHRWELDPASKDDFEDE